MTKQETPPTPPPQPTPRANLISGADREFLPAALEILETPPAPRAVAFMLTICTFVMLAVAWSFFGHLDIHAVAWGKVEANGRSKVIQPLEPGRIIAIMAENGRAVEEGQVLVVLDPADAAADERAFSDQLTSLRAEIARRRRAVAIANVWSEEASAGARDISLRGVSPDDRMIAFDGAVPEPIRARERAVLIADLESLAGNLGNIEMQVAQRTAMRNRLDMSISVQNELLKTLEERVDVRSATFKLKVGTSLNLFDAQEALHKSKVQLASDKGQLIETAAAIDELRSQKTKAVWQYIADNQTKLADAERKIEEVIQQLAKARTRLSRTVLKAPVDGVVQQLAATTIGQVVSPGQQLLVVAPTNGTLQVEAYVSNTDIGFVKVGQDAEVKIDAFPFTRFGTLKAKVIKIASDALDEQEARRLQANPLAGTLPAATTPSGGSGQPQSFVFPITLALETSTIKVGDAAIPVTPGMTVSAEIKTDSRRVIDYLLSPIAKVRSEAMKER